MALYNQVVVEGDSVCASAGSGTPVYTRPADTDDKSEAASLAQELLDEFRRQGRE